MMSSILFCVADSGGTTTTWLIARTDGSFQRITTSGLHPAKVFSEPKLLRDAVALLNTPPASIPTLYFYGTGLMSDEKGRRFAELLRTAGFRHAEVFSDGLAACRALLQNESGSVAILGTGSVLMEYDGSEITAYRGGLGALMGDEGSAFYFGKLVLKDYFRGRLDAVRSASVQTVLGDIPRSILASPHAILEIANLARVLDVHLFEHYHRANFEAFFMEHFSRENSAGQQLHISGSYGAALRQVLVDVGNGFGVKIDQIIDDPTELLYSYHRTAEKK